MLQIIYVHVRISAFIPNLRFEKKLEDEFEFEKTFIWWHSLVRKTQIF